MSQKRLTIVAIACGCVCALCVFAFMGTIQGEANAARAETLARYGGEQIDVCVAARDIAAGERVDSGAVEMKLWVADLLPEEAIRESKDVVGRTATTSILAGEVLSEKRFDQVRDMLDIPQGMAAVSVPAKTVQAVGGAVKPGMEVDIYAAGDTGADLIAEHVLVLATSSDEGGSLAQDASWVTVSVAPDHAQEIVTAASRFDLYFVLPGENAPNSEDLAAASSSDADAAPKSAENASKASSEEQPLPEESAVSADVMQEGEADDE